MGKPFNEKLFKDIMRKNLAPEKVIYNREVNHCEFCVKIDGNKKTISYYTRSIYDPRDLDLITIEYINDLLDKVYVNKDLDFDYNEEN